jgi:hypothetical protein
VNDKKYIKDLTVTSMNQRCTANILYCLWGKESIVT